MVPPFRMQVEPSAMLMPPPRVAQPPPIVPVPMLSVIVRVELPFTSITWPSLSELVRWRSIFVPFSSLVTLLPPSTLMRPLPLA